MTAIADPPPAANAARSVDRYFVHNGARLRYREEGHGPAVVLVHGWTLDLEMWEPQVAALRNAFRLVRLDRRGFGLSSGCPAPELDVADLDALLRHLALGRVSLVGMSQGARAVLGFAATAPARVSCLVLDGPPDLDAAAGADDDVPLAEYRELVRTLDIAAFRSKWINHPLTQLRTRDPGAHRLLNAMIERYPGTDLLHEPAPAGARAGAIALECVAAPALVITGEHDLARRVAAADSLARRLPHAERAAIPNAGHLPNLDNPDAYNNLVRAFLGRQTSAQT